MPEKILFEDMSERTERIISEAPDGSNVVLPSGKVFLSRKVRVNNKKNLTITGNGTVIISRFDPLSGVRNYYGAFDFTDCENICLRGIAFDTDNPVNSAGKILSVNPIDKTITVRIYEDCVLDGNQSIFALNSMDAKGTPDYLISSYRKTDYECLGEGVVRIFCPGNMLDGINSIPDGEQICLRFGVGGYDVLENAALTFHNCNDTVLEDIEVLSSAGYMTVVFPRCCNFTLNNYRVAVPKDSNRLMASNVDAIHLLGLTGKLTVKDCFFDGLGDDAVNIHSTAGTVEEVYSDRIVLKNERFSTPLEKEWCRPGDVLAVYDRKFKLKCRLTAEEYNNSTVICHNSKEKIAAGDIIANTAFYAETNIRGCTVRNSRARAFLLQTENISISDCFFYGISLPAILVSPDIEHWCEAGPSRNTVIEKCTFEKCAFANPENQDFIISVRNSHDITDMLSSGVHRNITVKNNSFLNTSGNEIGICGTDGVRILNNRVFDGKKVFRNVSATLKNCTDVTGDNFYDFDDKVR